MYGKGLRSIRIRFTLLVLASCVLGVGTMLVADPTQMFGDSRIWFAIAIIAAVIAVPSAVTYYLAGSLVGNIRALKKSAEAIIAGDINRPVEVDCDCEVGGLAESFRQMVGRLNSNILRMNVLAYHDAVTGFSNRTVVQHVLAKALDGPEPMPLSVLFIDLDGFKTVNDTLGHDAGDELLRQVAVRIVEQGLLCTKDIIDDCTTAYGELCDRPPNGLVFGRFAGDEFVAVLPRIVDEQQILAFCNRIQAAMQEPLVIGADSVRVGVSIGVARAPLDATSSTEILIDADMAMYAAKDRGRGRTVFFDNSLRQRLLERQQLEEELRVGIETDQFIVHYQPKYDARTLDTVGYEALVRWQHPTRGLLTPGAFLELAEKNNLMCDLGAIVFQRVIEQIKAWSVRGQELPVAVNVSPSQFRNPLLCDRIRFMLETNRIDPRLIDIEITEQAAMVDYSDAAPKLEKLRKLGVRLVVDDFGIGYSNLTQLVNLPFDVLKIDKSLVDDIGVSTRSEVVIESLVTLAHRMGHITVAEGIEQPEQLAFLKHVGCDQLQGFLLARPCEASSLPLVPAVLIADQERAVA